MKVKKTIKHTSKLLKLKLIKSRIYKKRKSFYFLKAEKIEHNLKKSFQVIYKYHINNKKILFLSFFSIKKLEKLLIGTRHKFLTETNWFNGKITNRSILKEKKLKNNYHLVIILDSFVNKNILRENYKNKIPIIKLHNNFDFFNLGHNYSIVGDFSFNKKKIRENFFFNLLKVIFKRAKRINKKKLEWKHNTFKKKKRPKRWERRKKHGIRRQQ